jgi:hypothetical protein
MLFWFFSLLTALVSWSNLTSSLSPLLTTDGGGWGVTRQTQTGLISKVIPSQDADKKGTDPIGVIVSHPNIQSLLMGAFPFYRQW